MEIERKIEKILCCKNTQKNTQINGGKNRTDFILFHNHLYYQNYIIYMLTYEQQLILYV